MESITMRIVSTTFVVVALATNADAAKSQADRIGWYVAGAFRPVRFISDAEARKVIDDWNKTHPGAPVEYDYKRESGKEFNADTMQLEDAAESRNVRFSLLGDISSRYRG